MKPARARRSRLDDVLVERGLADSREAASRLLLAGQMRVGEGDGGRIDRKPGELVNPDVAIVAMGKPRFVSRGGEKLDAALEAFGIDASGRICLDVGASTGGFTDALLSHGAARVYALDVGHGQLAESLRNNPRVVSMERTHAARLDPADAERLTLPEPISLAVIDVSFISLTRVLRGVAASLASDGEIVALVKPQFEVDPADAPRGVVRDASAQEAAIEKVSSFATSIGMQMAGRIESPLRGPKGNREFRLHLRRT